MKKTILMITFLALAIGCSKDKDETEDIITFGDERMGGVWYMNKVIKPDGAIEDYIHSCSTSKDRVEMSLYDFKEYYNSINCEEFYSNNSCQPIITNFTTVTGCNFKYNGTYTLSGNTLSVDYGEVRFFGSVDNNFEYAKGLILTRN